MKVVLSGLRPGQVVKVRGLSPEKAGLEPDGVGVTIDDGEELLVGSRETCDNGLVVEVPAVPAPSAATPTGSRKTSLERAQALLDFLSTPGRTETELAHARELRQALMVEARYDRLTRIYNVPEKGFARELVAIGGNFLHHALAILDQGELRNASNSAQEARELLDALARCMEVREWDPAEHVDPEPAADALLQREHRRERTLDKDNG